MLGQRVLKILIEVTAEKYGKVFVAP